MLKSDLCAAYLAGGIEAAAELARSSGLQLPAGAELTDLELELVAGGKQQQQQQRGGGRGNRRK